MLEAARLHDDLSMQRLFAAIRFGQQRDWMDEADGHLMAADAVEHVGEATGICAGDDRCVCFFDVAEFAVEKLVGHFRLNQIVNARAAAAPVAFGEFDQLQVGNRFQGPGAVAR